MFQIPQLLNTFVLPSDRFSKTKISYEKFIIKQNPLLNIKYFFQNGNIYCHITKDTISMTHQ